MAREHVLIIEDEEDIRELIRYNLDREGYRVSLAASGEEGLRLARERQPDLVVLDLMLPGIDGLDVCRMIRRDAALKSMKVIMVTAKGEEPDIVAGLELGADDYITKPFRPRVLLARIKAVLRRQAEGVEISDEDGQSILQRGPLHIHPGRHEVTVEGQPVELTYTEFRILNLLARRPGWVLTRYQIVDAVRGEEHSVSDRSVDVQIVGLRRKLGAAAEMIETVRGVGYRFRSDT